jgi:hypothetical protein
LQAAQFFRDFVLQHRPVHHRQQPFRQFKRAVDFPSAALRFHSLRRDHKHDSIGLRDEPAEPILPRLAGLDVLTVDERRKTNELKSGQQLVGEVGRIPAGIGDEDLELLSCILDSVAHG